MSRHSSTNTILQVQKPPPIVLDSPYVDVQSNSLSRYKGQDGQDRDAGASPRPRTPSLGVENASSSSSSQSEDEGPLSRSKAYTRRSRFPSIKAPLGPLSDADEDSEDSPPFLPFSDKNAKNRVGSDSADPGATVKISPRLQKAHLAAPSTLKQPHGPPATRTIHSSSSSAQSQSASREPQPPRVPLSSLSPRQRRITKEGSDGSPSMGSSFSDLDDASVTQSALEEALANEMRHGGVASRMSTISQALRSRYL